MVAFNIKYVVLVCKFGVEYFQKIFFGRKPEAMVASNSPYKTYVNNVSGIMGTGWYIGVCI